MGGWEGGGKGRSACSRSVCREVVASKSADPEASWHGPWLCHFITLRLGASYSCLSDNCTYLWGSRTQKALRPVLPAHLDGKCHLRVRERPWLKLGPKG